MPDKKVELMSEANVVLTNARINSGKDLVDIHVGRGRISAVTQAGRAPVDRSTTQIVDAAGRVVIPGVIDTHVHLGNGPQDLAADIHTETQVAARGGVTTMCPFLITQGDYAEVLGDASEAIEKSCTDIVPQVGIVNKAQIDQISDIYHRYGVRHFKSFMGYKGKEASPSGIAGLSDVDILNCMAKIAQLPGARLTVHCEMMEIIEKYRAPVEALGRQDSPAWTESRPLVAEYAAMAMVISFSRATGCPVTIPHISFGSGLDRLRALASGLDVQFETCPHYLLLDSGIDIGVWGKVNPPLRAPEERRLLVRSLAAGIIDVIGTDHCPFDEVTKGDDLWSARPGIPNGFAVAIQSVYESLGRDWGRDGDAIVQLCSTNAADAYGVGSRKGRLRPGYDADFALFEPETTWNMESSDLGGSAGKSPYDGRRFHGRVWKTFLRGKQTFDADNDVATPAGNAVLLTKDNAA